MDNDATAETLDAVLAHGLLNSMAVITGMVDTVRRHPDMDLERRDEMLGMAADQAKYVVETLKDMVRGLPADVILALETLR